MFRSAAPAGLAACVLLLASAAADAVVINSSDGAGNTSTTEAIYWNNVGLRGGGTGIYLGNYWVLTANHVGAGNINLGGTNYYLAAGSAIRVENPSGLGLSTYTDMLLFRITTDPGLPTIPYYSQAVGVNKDTRMVGYGRNRQEQSYSWAVTSTGWVQSTTNATYNGYMLTLDGGRSKRWGKNRTASLNLTINSGHGDVLSFSTQFDSTAGSDEGQGAPGDSGGAVFIYNPPAGQWQLAGMMHSVSKYSGQPDDAVVFSNQTYVADLYKYLGKIAEAQGASKWGDFNADRVVNSADIDLLRANLGNATYDLTQDRLTNTSDVDYLVRNILTTEYGDANLDGQISLADLVSMANNWNQAAGWASGDFSGDGVIGLADLIAMSNNWGWQRSSSASSAAAVPEPASLALLALGGVAALRRRRM